MQPHEPFDALLLDLGNVVLEIDFDRVIAAWARHAGITKEHIRWSGAGDAKLYALERGEIDIAAYFDHIRASHGLPLAHDQFHDGWNAIFVGVMEGVGPLLARAAQTRPLYAFSNTNKAHEAYWSRAYAETLAPFRQIFVSSTIGLRKPDRAAFDHVARAIQVRSERILFLDDLLENVEGARAAGFQAIHVTSAAEVCRVLEAVRTG